MSDIMEKMLEDEQNTDAKFVAAAEFFVGLKDKQASAPKAENVKAKKIRSQAAADVKGAVSRGGGQSVAMNRAIRLKDNTAVSGQANATDGRGMGGYKQVKPPQKNTQLAKVKVKEPKKNVKVVIASALRDELLKEGSLLNWFRGAKQVAGQATSKGTKAVADGTTKAVEGTKTFKDGFMTEPGTVAGNFFSNLKSNVGNYFRGGPALDSIKNVPAPNSNRFSRFAQWTKNLGRNPELVAREQAAGKRISDWVARNQKPTDPAKLESWTKQYNNMVAGQRGKLNTFKSGMDARNVTGLPETTASILGKVRGADGKITMDSVLKGAEDMGLFNIDKVVGLGMGAKATMDASRAAKAAAQRDAMMKWGLGGAAGIGALALLKRPSNKNTNA